MCLVWLAWATYGGKCWSHWRTSWDQQPQLCATPPKTTYKDAIMFTEDYAFLSDTTMMAIHTTPFSSSPPEAVQQQTLCDHMKGLFNLSKRMTRCVLGNNRTTVLVYRIYDTWVRNEREMNKQTFWGTHTYTSTYPKNYKHEKLVRSSIITSVR